MRVWNRSRARALPRFTVLCGCMQCAACSEAYCMQRGTLHAARRTACSSRLTICGLGLMKMAWLAAAPWRCCAASDTMKQRAFVHLPRAPHSRCGRSGEGDQCCEKSEVGPTQHNPAAWCSAHPAHGAGSGTDGTPVAWLAVGREAGVTAIYSGHDHNNDYIGTLEGIRLAYG